MSTTSISWARHLSREHDIFLVSTTSISWARHLSREHDIIPVISKLKMEERDQIIENFFHPILKQNFIHVLAFYHGIICHCPKCYWLWSLFNLYEQLPEADKLVAMERRMHNLSQFSVWSWHIKGRQSLLFGSWVVQYLMPSTETALLWSSGFNSWSRRLN